MGQAKSNTAEKSKKSSGVPASLARVVSLHLEGNLPEALSEVNGVIAAGDERLEVFSAKAQLQFELEMFEDAAQTYYKLLTLNPQHTSANFNLAICLEHLSRWQDAADLFQKVADTDPSKWEARLGLAIALLHLDKPDQAAPHFDQVLAESPANV